MLQQRAAAYTRTGILLRFLDQLSDSLPARVDNTYAEQRLGLKGGDVRAFLQSLRVFGITDAYGGPTERARRLRSSASRGSVIREALSDAYPELMERWELVGGLTRGEVEDFFKVEYGLSASSTGPAAKLYLDLMREYGPPPPATRAPSSTSHSSHSAFSPPLSPVLGVAPGAAKAAGPRPDSPTDVRLAALDAIKASLHIDINADWDEERISLVFDRMERLVDRILRSS